MKQKPTQIIAIISVLLFFSLFSSFSLEAQSASTSATSVVIQVNSNEMKVDGTRKQLSQNTKVVPLSKNNSVYVPSRAIADLFAATSTYKNGIYTIKKGSQTTTFNTNTNKAYINGKLASSAINAFYHQGLLYLPVGIIGKGLNQTVTRSGDTVTIGKTSSTLNDTRLVLLEANNKMMTVNGAKKQIDNDTKVVPLIKNGSIYAPARLVADQFGATSTYKNNIYIIVIGNQTTTFNMNTNKAYINGKLASSAINAFYHQGRLYLPVGIIGKGLNKTVRRDGNTVAIGTASAVQDYKESIQIPVLMYHHFDTTVQNGTIANPVVFEKQMKILKNAGYTTLTTDDVIAISKGEQVMPEKPIMITMDDGYQSNYDYVYPILKKLNMKATIFIITDYIEHPENHPSPYPKMTWDMIKEMSDSGLVSFQSHTDNMHYQSGGVAVITAPIKVNGMLETTEQYEKRVYEDLVRSKTLLEEKLGKPVTAFAYPMGLYSASSEKLLKQAGFELTLTTDTGLYNTKRDSLFLMKRVNIHGKSSAESVLTTIEKMRDL